VKFRQHVLAKIPKTKTKKFRRNSSISFENEINIRKDRQMDLQFVSSVHAHQVQPTVSILISSLFWDVTQRRIVVNYRPFGKIYRPLLQGSISPTTSKMGPLGCPETSVNTTLRYVIPQKIENLIYTLAEA
jgi:hypothetical protein